MGKFSPAVLAEIKAQLLAEHSEYDICPGDAKHLLECWNDTNINYADRLVSEPLVFSKQEVAELIPLLERDPEFQRLFGYGRRYWAAEAADHASVYGHEEY